MENSKRRKIKEILQQREEQPEVRGRNILIVEDILDTGLTIEQIINFLEKSQYH